MISKMLLLTSLISLSTSCMKEKKFNSQTNKNNSQGAEAGEANPSIDDPLDPETIIDQPEETKIKYKLSIGISGAGTVHEESVNFDCPTQCEKDFNEGTVLTFTANPSAGNFFKEWKNVSCKSGTASNQCTITMNQNLSLTASFETTAPQYFSLSLNPSTGGSVSSNPAGINCGSTCTASFLSGSSVQLNAIASAGYQFLSWEGDCAGQTASTCTLSMGASKTAKANFDLIPVVCTINKSFDIFAKALPPSIPAGYQAGSRTITLPSDATDISLRINQISLDDYSPTIKINDLLVYSLTEYFQRSHTISSLNINISDKLRAGDNLFWASVMDAFGQNASVTPTIVGSYKARNCNSTLYP